MTTLPPLAVYLHFPWCVAKCPYCDFNSHALRDSLPEDAYVDALVADLASQAARLGGQGAPREVVSVFMGGGTPSLFSPDAIQRVLEALGRLLALAPDAEVTLEANPATVERGRFAEYRDAGVNRVSLGAQSFDPVTLKALGRIHVPGDVTRAADELHASGLANFNLDLMFGLPGQTRAGALADLASALMLEPAHLSHYQLTLEPGTLFAAQPPELPDEELCWDMQVDCHALLAARGFAQYEVSAFARAGRQCRHNLNYWRFGDYLGAGAGAHGKLTREPEEGAGFGIVERSTHLREPRRYLATAAQGPQWRTVPRADLPFEYMMNALRLNEGFEPGEFTARTGIGADEVAPTVDALVARGLLEHAGQAVRATDFGRRFLNDLVAAFLPGTFPPIEKSQVRAGS